jgi:transcriptional regulator GlxA family with amidase domain
MLQGWRDGGRLFGLKIERSALETELAELVDHPVESVIPLGASLDLRSDPGRQWWALARSLVELIRAPEGPLARPMVARPLVHSVIAALLYAVDHPHRGLLEAEVAAPRAAAIRQAVELLDAEPERPWTVGEIARRVGVGPRALQNGFGRHVGVAPMAYLRQIRLSRVHADLRDSDPGRHTVAELAGRWGFSHLGRFAEVYRRRYGCAPSQTLHAGG